MKHKVKVKDWGTSGMENLATFIGGLRRQARWNYAQNRS